MRGLVVAGLAGALSIGLVGPAEAPTAQASTPKQHYGFNASEGARKAYKRYAFERIGRDRTQFSCLVQLWDGESKWNPNARAKIAVQGRFAGGIPQIVGLNPSTHPLIQIEKGLAYIQHRYAGKPCQALTHWRKQVNIRGYGWY